jgi:hypothetical protein
MNSSLSNTFRAPWHMIQRLFQRSRGRRTVANRFPAPKVYRLAVYGPKSSGKTTILAALGLGPGRSSPAGFSCSRQSRLPDGFIPSGAPESWTPEELRKNPVKAYYRGNLCIDEAEQSLRNGVPPPNSPNVLPLLLVYDLVIPGHGLVTFEVCEFAGELLNRAGSATDNARVLKDLLRQVDALLVLAEATHPGSPTAALADDLRLLQEAFLSFANERKSGVRLKIPVALLLNKWDRRGGPESSGDQRQGEVEQFLTESVLHKNLTSTLSDVSEHFMVFPVSAFGCHTSDCDRAGQPILNSDRPAKFPLPSYGLEDPFAWAITEIDGADVERVVSASQRIRWWNPAIWSTWRRAKSLRRRLGDATQNATLVSSIVGRAKRMIILQGGLCAIFCLLLVVGVEWSVDSVERGRSRSRLQNSDASEAEVEQALHWIDGYAHSSWVRHRAMKAYYSVEYAEHEYQFETSKRDEIVWEQAPMAPPEERLHALKNYLRRFPNGHHGEEARSERDKLAPQIQRETDRRRNIAVRATVRQDLQIALPKRDERSLTALWQQFKSLPPFPYAETTDDRNDREALGKAIVDALESVTQDPQRKEWVRTAATIERAVVRLDFGAAARELNAFAYPELPEVQEARRTFPKTLTTRAELAVAEAIKTRSWDNPIEKLKLALEDSVVIRLTRPVDWVSLGTFLKTLKVGKDQALYEDFLFAAGSANKEEKANRYKHQAPLQTMRADVDRWINWYVRMKQSTELEFEVEVDWNEWPNRTKVRVLFLVNGQSMIDELKPFETNGKSGAIKSGTVTLVPKQACSIMMQIITESGSTAFNGGPSASKEDNEHTPETLHGQSFMVDDARKTRIWVAVRGLPERPAAKQWTEPEP